MSFRPRRRFLGTALIGVAALTFAAGAALAAAPAARARKTSTPIVQKVVPARPAKVSAPVPAPAATAPAASLGLMAFLDPDTGLLTGPISFLVPPADPLAASASIALEPVPLPNGGWMLDLRGTGMESYVLNIDPLGQRSVSCVQDARTLSLPGGPVAPAAAQRKER